MKIALEEQGDKKAIERWQACRLSFEAFITDRFRWSLRNAIEEQYKLESTTGKNNNTHLNQINDHDNGVVVDDLNEEDHVCALSDLESGDDAPVIVTL